MISVASLDSPHASQLDWTREDGHLDTDVDAEDNEEEDYEDENRSISSMLLVMSFLGCCGGVMVVVVIVGVGGLV